MTKCTATRKTKWKKHNCITWSLGNLGNSSNQNGNSWVGGSRYPTIQKVPGNIGEGHCFRRFLLERWNHFGSIGFKNSTTVEVGRRFDTGDANKVPGRFPQNCHVLYTLRTSILPMIFYIFWPSLSLSLYIYIQWELWYFVDIQISMLTGYSWLSEMNIIYSVYIWELWYFVDTVSGYPF